MRTMVRISNGDNSPIPSRMLEHRGAVRAGLAIAVWHRNCPDSRDRGPRPRPDLRRDRDRARTKEERRGRARAIRTLRHDPDCPPSILQGGAAHVGLGSFSLWESLYQFAHAAHRARLNAIGKLVQAKRRRI